MIYPNKHIINSVFLEINTNSKEKGYYLKDNIDGFLQKEIFSLLENYFNELDSKNPSYSIQLDKLNLDIVINPNLDFEDFKAQILKKITKQVEEVFEKDKNREGYKLITPQEKEIERFFYFLETGTNSWWTTLHHDFKIIDDTTLDKVLNDETFPFMWANAVQKPITRTRFIKQFSDDQIATIIKKGIIFKENSADSSAKITRIDAIKKHIETSVAKNQLFPNQRFLTWEIVVLGLLEMGDAIIKQKLSRLIFSVFEFNRKNHFLKHKNLFLTEIENRIENQNQLELLANLDAIVLAIEKKIDKIILKEKGIQTVTKKQAEIETIRSLENNEKADPDLIFLKNKDATVHKDDKDSESLSDNSKGENPSLEKDIISDLYVDNAGLLLVHPFLKSLFENCKLLNKDNTIHNPETAAHLLHYIATGREQDYENAMPFEKFLCNIPTAKPIERNIVLPEEMKKEAEEVLQAVLNNWDIMKTSSTALLQNEFLQRPGKLSINWDESPTIIIERKTQDILLDKLSWNLSIIKLAWKKRIIYVNW